MQFGDLLSINDSRVIFVGVKIKLESVLNEDFNLLALCIFRMRLRPKFN